MKPNQSMNDPPPKILINKSNRLYSSKEKVIIPAIIDTKKNGNMIE